MTDLAALQRIAREYGVAYRDVVRLSLGTHGRYGRLSPEDKATVSDAGLSLFKQLGSDDARACYLKIRDASAPELRFAA